MELPRVFLVLFAMTVSLNAADRIQPHALPPGYAIDKTYTLEADGHAVPVIAWSKDHAFAHFSFEAGAPVKLRVKADGAIREWSLSPRREKIPVSVEGDTATFSVSERQYLAFRAAGRRTLLIFADPAEAAPPRPGDAAVASILDFGVTAGTAGVLTREINQAIDAVAADPAKSVLYFPPGVYRSGTIRLKNRVTLYLAAGAVLKASDDPADFTRDAPGGPYGRLNFITAYNIRDCGVRGRGVIDGNARVLREKLARLPDRAVIGRPGKVDANRIVNLQFSHVTNGFIEGVFSLDSSSWNTVPHYCTDLTVQNYKVVSGMFYKNDDGIDPDSCVRLTIRDSFFMARDDGIVLKTTGSYNGQKIAPDGTARDMENVLVSNNVVWCETAALKYGFNESEKSDVSRVRFERNVILNAREGVQIRTGGTAIFHDAVFQGNWYETIRRQPGERFPSYNYRLDDADAHDIRFVDETHDHFAEHGGDIKASRLLFQNLVIEGKARTTADAARFKVTGADVTLTVSP